MSLNQNNMPKYFLFLLTFSFIAASIEVEISVPGFPEMAKYFNVSESVIQLTIAYNFLGYAIAAFFYGPLSDNYGRRKMMMIGNGVLMLGALGTAYAAIIPNIYLLLAFRFIQGLGASTAAVVGSAMIMDIYKGNQSVTIVGIMNAVLTLLIASAPVIGGFINIAIGWQGNYWVVALITVLTWFLLLFLLPETKHNRDIFNLKKLLKNYKNLFVHQAFLFTSLAPTLIYAAYMAFISSASFLYVDTIGLSVLTYSIHQACIIAVFCLTSFLSGLVNQCIGNRASIFVGQTITLTGALCLLIVSWILPFSAYGITASMLLFSCGFAISYPVVYASSMEMFPEIKGTASSAIIGLRAFVVSLYVALNGYFFDGQTYQLALMFFLAVAGGFILFCTILKLRFITNK
ncbi:MAG: multidrug effflux MFS transporter [Chlamydiales bacterium]|nr:multidrug effflux MFS transporter [Chlamydiales bacterium]